MKQNETTLLTIEGRSVVNYLPTFEGTGALVNLNTLQKLVSLATQQSSFNEVKKQFLLEIRAAYNIESYMACIKEEIAFHSTVNKVRTVNLEELFNKDKKPVEAP